MIDDPTRGPGATPAGDAARLRSRFGWWDAVTVHADRFDQPRVVSVLCLLSAQRTVIVDGGVATVTEVGHTARRLGAVTAAYAVGVVAVVASLDRTPIAIVVGVLAATVVWFAATRCVTQLIAHRRFHVADQPWLVANVATVPGGGHGDQLMQRLTAHADRHDRRLVLTVTPGNERAIALYQRHGFAPTSDTRRRRLSMERTAPRPSLVPGGGRESGTPASASGPWWWWPIITTATLALAVATSVVLVGVYWGRPQVWLMPIAATVAVTAAAVDIAVHRIPNAVCAYGALTSIAVGTAASVALAVSVERMLFGAVVMGGPLFAANLLTRGRTPGLGDAKLAGALGLTVGAVSPTLAYLTIIAALLAGALWGAIRKALSGERTFPLAPAIGAATIAMLIAARLTGTGAWWTT